LEADRAIRTPASGSPWTTTERATAASGIRTCRDRHGLDRVDTVTRNAPLALAVVLSFDVSVLAEHVKALIDGLTALGFIGP
jgi:hypothetical protein